MKYTKRRKLKGQLVKKVTILIATRKYEALQKMKGIKGNAEMIEELIVEKRSALRREAISTAARAASR